MSATLSPVRTSRSQRARQMRARIAPIIVRRLRAERLHDFIAAYC